MFSNDIETLLNLVSEERKVNEDKVTEIYYMAAINMMKFLDIKKINAYIFFV